MNGGIVMRGVAGLVGLATVLAGVASATTTAYQWVQSISTPGVRGVAVDSSGNIWDAGATIEPVQEFSSTGTILKEFGSLYALNATALAFDSSGNVWVTNSDGLAEFSSSGTWLQSFYSQNYGADNVLAYPSGVAVASSGNLLVSAFSTTGSINDPGGIEKFSPSGTYLGQSSPLVAAAAVNSAVLGVWRSILRGTSGSPILITTALWSSTATEISFSSSAVLEAAPGN